MKNTINTLVLLILICINLDLKAQKLIRDINVGSLSNYYPSYLADVNGGFIFSGYDDTCGNELWFSDGTEAGTYRLLDINKGPGSTFFNSSAYIDTNGCLLFKSYSGIQIYWSDGTSKGTFPLIEFNSVAPQTEYNMVIKFRNKYYISGLDTAGNDIIISDGTASGTMGWIDLAPGKYNPSSFMNINNKLYIFNYNSNEINLYESDGTIQGTKFIKNIGVSSGRPVNIGNYIYFVDIQNILNQYDPVTDKVKTIYSNNKDILTGNLFKYKDKIYFNTYNSSITAEARKTWYFDTASAPLKLTLSDTSIHDCWIDKVIDLNDYSLFKLYTPRYGYELWKIENNGTSAKFLMDVNPGAFNAINDRYYFNYIKGNLYFSAFNEQYGYSLWKFETATEQLSLHYYVPQPFKVYLFFLSHGKTYMTALIDSTIGGELYSLEIGKTNINSKFINNLKPYPNPISAGAYLNMDNISSSAEFRLYDLRGKAILLTEENGRILIPDYLRPGLYNLVIQQMDTSLSSLVSG